MSNGPFFDDSRTSRNYGEGQNAFHTPYQTPADPYQRPVPNPVVTPKSKIAAGVLGILIGGLGIHNFYLGYTKLGMIQLLLSLCSFGLLYPFMSIWGFFEGILYLVSSAPRWSYDARGLPLYG